MTAINIEDCVPQHRSSRRSSCDTAGARGRRGRPPPAKPDGRHQRERWLLVEVPSEPATVNDYRREMRHRPWSGQDPHGRWDHQLPFEVVLEAAQGHAGWALTRLYESLAPAVTGYLRANGVREAEDATSEVFLAVLRRCSSFQGDEVQFRRWVFTIAHRRIIDTRRSNGRRPEVGSLDAHRPSGMEPGRSPAAEDDALQAMGSERVRRLLSVLSTDQRCVLALRVVADLSVEDVAIALDKPPGAVKALQRRGLATLRRTLSQQGGGDEIRA